ncbi:MAG: BON domain-containing protein [Acidobacteriota bacterium]|nr:BON domain-containing protein [Acidobacteriota bacterium]
MRDVIKLGGIILLMSGVAVLSSACGSSLPVQKSLNERTNEALKEARFDQVVAAWDAQSSVMRLRGFVQTPAEKRQAEQVAETIVGGSGTVASELAVSLRGAPAPAPVVAASDDLQLIDERIHRDVEQLFADKKVWSGREFEILVNAGEVRLTGHVLTQEEKDRVTEMVARVAGVTEVVNRLALKNPANPDQKS